MSFIRNLMVRFGLSNGKAERTPIQVFLLDDDERRHRWFERRFEGDSVTIAETVEEAKKCLEADAFDAIFLDHDLLPRHDETQKELDGLIAAVQK